MIKIENIDVYAFEAAIRGARNARNSWDRMDSCYNNGEFEIGENDYKLLKNLTIAGPEHRKWNRMVTVTMDITAPMYWFSEYDTYKVGTVANSTSKMHRLLHKPFELSDFSFDHLIGENNVTYFDTEIDENNEVWKDCVGFEDYSVSNYGRVYSKRRDKLLKLCVNSSNYKKCVLKGKNLYVHRLVAQAFLENPNNLEEVNHKDGNKWNNNVDNLEWVSKSENAKHAFDLGLRNISGYTRYKVAQSGHMFSQMDIDLIFEMYAEGMSKKEIAQKMGCYDSTICNILNGKTYNQINLSPMDTAKLIVDHLNELRDEYLKCDNEAVKKEIWYNILQLLPNSYNQKRTVHLNYEVLGTMYKQRRHHKLSEWQVFCDTIKTLSYSEFITREFE